MAYKSSDKASSLAARGILLFSGLFSGSIVTKRHKLNQFLAYAYKYTLSCTYIVHDLFQWYRSMPKCSVAAGFITAKGEGYSLHKFS